MNNSNAKHITTIQWSFCVLWPFLVVPISSYGQELAVNTTSVSYRTPYAIAKPIVSSSFSSTSSLDQRRGAVLRAAEVGYGRRATGALGNSIDVLARTPGGLNLALRLAVDNASVRKGALRAARVAGALNADSRFQIVALDQPARDYTGRLLTDRDIAYRHRATGALGRIEVKDVSEASQRTKLQDYKRQIRLMGLEQRQTGQQQAFVNRRKMIPELREYANRHRVLMFENVVTSSRNAARTGTFSISDVFDTLDQNARVASRLRTAGIGIGLLVSAFEGPRAVNAWQNYSDGNGSLSEASFRTMSFASGGSFAVSGVTATLATNINASSRSAMLLGRIGKTAGPLGAALAAGAMSVRGYQWYSGELNNRQFTTEVTSAGGGIAGAWAGAGAGGWAGAKLGGVAGAFVGPEGIPPGAAIGGFFGSMGGAIAGAWAGQTITGIGIESIYSRLEVKQQDELLMALRRIYESKAR